MAATPHDIDSLAQQLLHDGVAFDSDNPANWELEGALMGAADNVGAGEFPDFGMVVLEQTPLDAAQMRDLAQDLNMATGIDTVIVRAPHAGAAVSDTLTRAQVEQAEAAMLAEPDYAAGVEMFAAAAGESAIGIQGWLLVFGAVLIAVAAVAVSAAYLQRRIVKV